MPITTGTRGTREAQLRRTLKIVGVTALAVVVLMTAIAVLAMKFARCFPFCA